MTKKPKLNWQREKKILKMEAGQWEMLSDAQDYTIELLMKDIAKLKKEIKRLSMPVTKENSDLAVISKSAAKRIACQKGETR